MKILFQWDIKIDSKLMYEFTLSDGYENMHEFKDCNEGSWGILEYEN